MLCTKTFIPTLVYILLFFTNLSNAVPASPITPHRTLALREATASAAAASSTGSNSGSSTGLSTSSDSSSQPSDASSSTPTTTSFKVTATNDLDGIIEGCNYGPTTGDSQCSTGGQILSTDSAMWTAWNARVSSLAAVSVPASGCAIGTAHDGSNTQYCTCAGSGTLSASSVSTILGYPTSYSKSITLTTACNTGPGSLPTDYVEVPPITDDNTNQLWAQTPSIISANLCTTGDAISSDCWGILQMDSYVKWWWSAFNSTCTKMGKGSFFADCFQTIMTPLAPTDCSALIINGYCPKPDWSDFQDQWNGLRNFYIAWNIKTMNTFMVNYYNAIGTASTIASEMVGEIVNTLNPIKKTNVGLNNVLTALSAGLAFIPGPEAGIGKAIIAGVKKAPTVAKHLFPEGTTNSQLVDMQDISGNLGTTTKSLQESVALALPAMTNDSDAFAAFAASGAFSTFISSENDLANNILNGLNAYVISQAYQENGIFITRQLNTSVSAYLTNGTNTTYALPCTTGYDSNGICDTFWYDSVDDTTYALTSGDQTQRWKSYESDMVKWFTNFTLPEILFRGAANCAAASNTNQGTGSPLSISSTDFNTDCLSNMKVCTWSIDPVQGDAFPVFSDCNETNSFQNGLDSGHLCKGAGSDCFGICSEIKPYLRAWRQYLGWGVNEALAETNKVMVCAGNSPEV